VNREVAIVVDVLLLNSETTTEIPDAFDVKLAELPNLFKYWRY